MSKSFEQAFWEKVSKDGPASDWDTSLGPCWLWKGATNGSGYGLVWARGLKPWWFMAHRVAFELLKAPIPEGLVLDHLCRVRRCVNPDHLEPVTNRENVVGRSPTAITAICARRTACINGHPFTPANTVPQKRNGVVVGRACRECCRLASIRYRQRKVALSKLSHMDNETRERIWGDLLGGQV